VRSSARARRAGAEGIAARCVDAGVGFGIGIGIGIGIARHAGARVRFPCAAPATIESWLFDRSFVCDWGGVNPRPPRDSACAKKKNPHDAGSTEPTAQWRPRGMRAARSSMKPRSPASGGLSVLDASHHRAALHVLKCIFLVPRTDAFKRRLASCSNGATFCGTAGRARVPLSSPSRTQCDATVSPTGRHVS